MCGHLVEAPLRVARRDHVGVAGLREVLGAELAHGLEEPEAATERARTRRSASTGRPGHRGGRRRRRDRASASATIASAAAAIERAGEDRQTPEHRLLRWRQQVERPLDGRPQRPMPLDAGPPAAGQEPQTIVEPLHQIRRREAPGAGGGQLDGERDAVEAAADLLDVVPAGVRVERPRGRRRPLVEQLDARPRRFQRRDDDELLVAEAEALPRGGEHPDVRAALGDGLGQFAAAPSMTCSQLSSTSSARRDCSAVTIDSVNVRPRLSFTSRTLATARGTSLDEPCAGELDEPCAATPGAARRRRRPVRRRPGRAASCRSLPAPRASRSGSVASAVADELEVVVAADQPTQATREVPSTAVVGPQRRMLCRRRVGGCAARRRRLRGGTSRGHAGCSPSSSADVTPDTSVWPPWPAAASRAATIRAGPK